MTISVRSMILFSGISAAAAAASAIQPPSSVGVMLTNNLQCNETDALLKVSYTIDKEGWDNIYHKNDEYTHYKPEVKVRPSGNIGNSTLIKSVEYESYDDVKDFEICIPRDGACLELTVYQFPFDSYDITYDGEKVDIDHEFEVSKFSLGQTYPLSSTEIGESCKLECDESKDEALFEYQFWGRDENDQYSVQDEKGDMILGCSRDDISLIYESFGLCSKSFYDFSVYIHRACLPRNSCYQFLTASKYEYSEYDRRKQMMLSFDGNLLEKSEAYFFKTIPFGNNCKPTCNPVNESMVEFLLSHDLRPEMNGNSSGSRSDDKAYVCESIPDMGPTWDLSVDDVEVSSGLIPYCSNLSLFREVVCLPRNSCGTFSISNSNVTRGQISYSLTMDDVTHRSVGIYSGSFSNPHGWNETTNIGWCTVDGLCDGSSQALFEADLLTPTEYVSNGKSLPVIPKSWESIWTFGNSTGDYFKEEDYYSYGHHPPLFRSRDYVLSLYELGSVYRTIECVPIDAGCDFEFTVKEQQLVFEKYEVRRNGMALSREVVEETDHWDYTTIEQVTAFGENCNAKKLSGGAIAGIVIGSLAAVIIAVYGFLWYKKKKEEEAVAEDTNNPLTASLLAEAGGTERMTENSGDGTAP